MKKQILILVFFVLATFASVTNSYGQCVPAPLTPSPGVLYDYSVTVTGTAIAPKYLWYVTSDVNVLTGTKLATTDGFFTAGAGYNDVATGTATQSLTWTSNAIGNIYYLVVRYTEESVAAGCTVQNMKVYQVKPINTFLLAITGSDASGATVASATTCAADITGALVTVGTPTIKYTYGTNILYYKITASGINGNWRPQLRIPALGTSQTYTNVEWSANNGTSYAVFNGFVTGTSASTDLTAAVGSDVAATVAGTDYLVKITIANNDYENTGGQPLALGVDGLLPTAYTTSDIIGGAGATPCNQEAVFGKTATFTILGRPAIAPVAATGAFITKLP